MKLVFLGVGEAFDENIPNNSQLLVSDKTKLLVDCGFTVPTQVWKYNPDPNLLDVVYISHQHGDHFSGLPALLLRMWEGKRERDLTIISQKSFVEFFDEFMEIVYKGFKAKFGYKINLVVAEEGKEVLFNDLKFDFSKTVHSGENLAVKITDGKNVYAYSGDGSPQAGTDFYKDLDLLILETYLYDKEIIGHSSIVSAIKFAKENNAKCLALTHINRDLRKNEIDDLRKKISDQGVKVIIPETLEEFNF